MNGFKFLLDLGVSLTWFALIPPKFSSNPGSATYSIDGQTPIFFSVPGSNSYPIYNQVLFKTKTLSYGRHELIVTFQGSSDTAPLALDSFVVQNGTSNSSNSVSTGNDKLPVAGIVVGVVSGVFVFVLLLLLYIRRRNNRGAQKLKENPNPEPFTLRPQDYTPEAISLTPRPSKISPNREPASTNVPGTNTSEVLSRNPRSFSSTTSQSREPATNAPDTHTSEVLSSRIPRSFSSKTSRSRESASNAPQAGPSRHHDTSPPVTEAADFPIRNTESMQPSTSTSTQDDDLVLQHTDSGVRTPELPPAYQAVEVASPVADNQTRQF